MQAARNMCGKYNKGDETAGKNLSFRYVNLDPAYAQDRFQRTLMLIPGTLRKSRKSTIEAEPPQPLCNSALVFLPPPGCAQAVLVT